MKSTILLTDPSLKRTPLFPLHQRLGARLVDFGGWEMPVQYSGIMDEHRAVRAAAGLFDISHMGEVTVSGAGAESFLNHLLTNDVAKLREGQGQYTMMCNENGGVIDDLYAYRIGELDYLLVINASRIEADFAWMKREFDRLGSAGQTDLANASEQWAAIALQGPATPKFIERCFHGASLAGTRAESVCALQKNELGCWKFKEANVWISRTGYSGEDGFEIFCPQRVAEPIWTALATAGADFGLKPCGLGARDTLRLEACYPLYGHELDENTTPLEAGLKTFVSFEKGDFNGRSALVKQRDHGVEKRCVAFKMSSRGAPPRPGYAIWSTGDSASEIGRVVSGSLGPSLDVGVGMGYVPSGFAKKGTEIEIAVRDKRYPAVIVPKPFLRKQADAKPN